MAGKLITLDGIDGSGKGTQANLLLQRLQTSGYRSKLYDFPQYGKASAYFVEQYLKGNYPAEMTDAYQASIFYAVDRYEAALSLQKELADGVVVVVNRYTTSSLAHQGGKIADRSERHRFFRWVEELEYRKLKIPKPSKVIILQVPAVAAQKLVDQKAARPHLEGATRDLHEADLTHLQNAEEVYLELAQLDPKLYRLIDCYQDDKIMSIEGIHEQIWREVLPTLESAT